MNILVVDDDPDVIEAIALSFGLQWPEARTIQAKDGRSAIAAVSRDSPDVVLLDIALPDMDGFEVLRRVRERSDVPVLMISARGEERDKVRGLELGADDYITKPFGYLELSARVRAVMRRAQSLPPVSTDPTPERRAQPNSSARPAARRSWPKRTHCAGWDSPWTLPARCCSWRRTWRRI